MPTVNEINEFFYKRVPYSMKWEFDNVGFLAGNGGTVVKTVLAALDITDAVIGEAVEEGAQLIVSHHPLIREPMNSVTTNSVTGGRLVRLIENGISAICLHTNLDCAMDGTSDALCRTLGLRVTGILDEELYLEGYGAYGIGKIGELGVQQTLCAFLDHTKSALGANGLRYVDGARPVYRVAVCGGSGGEYIRRAHDMGCDTYVTADVKHGQFLEAGELGINLIDAGHFPTENVVVPRLAELLREGFPELEIMISRECRQTEYYC